MSQSKDAWETFGIRIGPFGIDINSPGHTITHTQTETSHLLQIRLDPAAKKEAIKVRLVRPGLLEIEWPRVKAARQNNLCISDLGASAYAASAANTENKAAMPMAILFWRGP